MHNNLFPADSSLRLWGTASSCRGFTTLSARLVQCLRCTPHLPNDFRSIWELINHKS